VVISAAALKLLTRQACARLVTNQLTGVPMQIAVPAQEPGNPLCVRKIHNYRFTPTKNT